MASVTSLDKDLRKLRLDKYTPAAANEVKSWIENILGERLPSSDLLDGLKDGVALCKLANLALPPPGIKFKKSAMPFIQMENISHFLRACQSPPLNLQDHDMFLTVDLYEQKDPAQVLQCLGSFSRAAARVNPSTFPSAIGARTARGGGVLSPQSTGPATPTSRGGNDLRGRGTSNASNASSAYGRGAPSLTASRTGEGRWSPTKSPTGNGGSGSPPVNVSSWSTRAHEGATSPAWNIAQYGYMGGASQGALGIAFGGRRQITSAGPHVPGMAEKEKKRRVKEAEAEAQRVQMEEEEERRKAEVEAEEERARVEEERRWEDEARRLREQEARRIEEEKRKWEEEERQWKLEEERRKREEEEAEKRLQQERTRSRGNSDARLRGQFLSQYQAEQGVSPGSSQRSAHNSEYGNRIKELEKELELARQREAEYERDRQGRSRRKPDSPEDKKSKARSRSRPASRPPSRQDSWRPKDDRGISVSPLASPNIGQGSQWSPPLQQDYGLSAGSAAPPPPPRSPRPLPDPKTAAPPPSAPLKKQRTGEQPPALPVRKHHTGSRPLPDPTAYASTPPPAANAAARPPPASIPPAIRSPPAAIRSPQNNSPFARPDRYGGANPTSSPAAAAKPAPKKQSLLEREMELERQRQREWEEAQKETATRARGDVDGVGGRWDVSQWSGYTGGDTQNKGAQGIGAGRRQIVGPRPLPGAPR
ncbi:hypothetical protein CONLIGDRAFT_666467 [Coniochaeta ligniaria NRRL 30616]|uniref:Calponin-homology (CH) domain-containing protein n=1 Tax=Coniochaeta ligniaria NRRL 30616 TaxID=1408157 RepID=A0A1J7JIA8_9PEZI|nr:hypothetical protein CONLIGDRAFT_666467 [Coniochaeta ligniaria NRRL 30616]